MWAACLQVAVLRRLQGTLNVAQLVEALEDDVSVHIIMEYCRGGELWNYIGKLHHYSERTARPRSPSHWTAPPACADMRAY